MNTLQVSLLGSMALAAFAMAQGRGGGARPAATPPPEQSPPAAAGEAGVTQPPARGTTPGVLDKEDVATLYFKTADYDANGWISFAEAKSSMNLDRQAFAVFDTDRDGRISAAEFAERHRAITSRGGAFAPPAAKPDARRVPKRTVDELMAEFDSDHDGTLDVHDIERALKEYGAQSVDAALVLATVDRDKSQLVEKEEAQALLDVLVPPSTSAAKKKYASIEALLDQPEVRKREPDTTPHPTRILGPVSTFRRLDFDNSGGISVEDLEALQRPLLVPIRPRAVIATLDLDGDGILSPAEFAAALR